MVPVTQREFTRAYRSHRKAYTVLQEQTDIQPSSMILLFYAVECGLKAAWMRRNQKNSTDQCDGTFENFGHNINSILDALRVGGSRELRLPRQVVIRRHSGSFSCTSNKLNEVTRYGVDFNENEQVRTVLQNLLEWIGEEFL